jgi:glycosyltransferase involved in cell wall biosynthesis
VKRKKIAFVTSGRSRFTDLDLDILRSAYEVEWTTWRSKKQLPRLLASLATSDISFSYFASDHALIATTVSRLLRKKSVIVTGGNDVVEVPDIGEVLPEKAKRRTRKALLQADLVLPFSKSSEDDMKKLAVPKRSEVLYLGVDTEMFKPAGAKEDLVVTAGWITKAGLLRKGHEPFVKAAALLPDIKFRFIYPAHHEGAEPETFAYLRKIAPPNLEFKTDEEIVKDFQQAKVYVQASGHEGFGLANAEAMACGCVPVVTRRGALPEVVGDAGVYAEFNQVDSLAGAIVKAMNNGNAAKARQRILENFTLDRRRRALLSLLGGFSPS